MPRGSRHDLSPQSDLLFLLTNYWPLGLWGMQSAGMRSVCPPADLAFCPIIESGLQSRHSGWEGQVARC